MLQHAPQQPLLCIDFRKHMAMDTLKMVATSALHRPQAYAFLYPTAEAEARLTPLIKELLAQGKFVSILEAMPSTPRAEAKEHGATLFQEAQALVLPPLRTRPEDLRSMIIAELADLSRADHNARLAISNDALSLLINYSFPGNEQELISLLTIAATRAEQGLITEKNMAALIGQAQTKTQAELQPDSEDEPLGVKRRTRGRPAPRARRR